MADKDDGLLTDEEIYQIIKMNHNSRIKATPTEMDLIKAQRDHTRKTEVEPLKAEIRELISEIESHMIDNQVIIYGWQDWWQSLKSKALEEK